MLAPAARRAQRAAPRDLPRLHAEQNAIIQAARYGINITGASIYINTQPCVVCAKMLINAGIDEIVYQNPYPDDLSMSMLEEAGMKLRVFEG